MKTTDKKNVLNIAIVRDMWDNNPVIILYFFKIKIASAFAFNIRIERWYNWDLTTNKGRKYNKKLTQTSK